MKAHVKCWLVLPLTIAALGLSTPTWAAKQTAKAPLLIVNVDLRNANILSKIANNLDINISNVPVTVQAPISVAANVCDVDVAILSTAIDRGGASCYAQSTSSALNKIVQRVVNLQLD
jgi:hypothetical protein